MFARCLRRAGSAVWRQASKKVARAALPRGQRSFSTETSNSLGGHNIALAPKHQISAKVGSQTVLFETGHFANSADGAVVVSAGRAQILVTALSAPVASENNFDGVPLFVEFHDHTSTSNRQNTKEIVASRLLDHSIRPLFVSNYFNDTNITAVTMSRDPNVDSVVLSINAASCALLLSDIPWNGPIGAVRVARVGGEWIVEPDATQRQQSDATLVYVASEHRVLVLDGYFHHLPQEQLLQALDVAANHVSGLHQAQRELAARISRRKRPLRQANIISDVILKEAGIAVKSLQPILTDVTLSKVQRDVAFGTVKTDVVNQLHAKYADVPLVHLERAFELQKQLAVRTLMLNGFRSDGRALDQVRPWQASVDIWPSVDGSAFCGVGETESMCGVTLGRSRDGNAFEFHFDMPGFAVRSLRNVSPRRSLGRAFFIENALRPVLPPNTFPYSVICNSIVTGSDGGSQGVSLAAATLALLDAGVPLSDSVASVSMGLVSETNPVNNEVSNYKLLADITALEDVSGDMDLHVVGSRRGLTAIQMDVRNGGVPLSILKKAILDSVPARSKILDQISKVAPSHRREVKSTAPKNVAITIRPEQRRVVIGNGGATIRHLQELSGASLAVEDNKVWVSGPAECSDKAVELLTGLLREFKNGDSVQAIVSGFSDYGLVVQLAPTREATVRLQELNHERTSKEAMTQQFKIGETITLKCTGNDQNGRPAFSRKATLPAPAAPAAAAARPSKKTESKNNNRDKSPLEQELDQLLK